MNAAISFSPSPMRGRLTICAPPTNRMLSIRSSRGGVGDGIQGPAVGPAAAERQIESKSYLLCLLCRETEAVEELRRQEREISQARLLAIERERIGRLHLKPTDPAFLHQ